MRPSHLLALALVITTAISCATVGNGTRTIVKHRDAAPFLLQTYPHLVTDGTATADRIIHFDSDGKIELEAAKRAAKMGEFSAYMQKKYGASGYVPLALEAAVHDRTTVPTFLPVDFRKHLASVLLADTKLSMEERQRRFTILVNQPDLYNSTTMHTSVSGVAAYRYFPRVSVDFSSSLTSPSPLDRISFLLIVIQLKTQVDVQNTESLRFLNFSPKEADFVEFTRGQFSQALQAAVSANASAVDTIEATTTADPTTRATAGQNTVGLTSSLSFSESYVSALTDAIERRSTGLLDGQTFYAAFRSIREVRIGGTYNFDLMLQVPSVAGLKAGPVQPWPPAQKEVRADIYMIGVVRHVHDRGQIGFLSKVPESENDDVYEQVVVEVVPNVLLWKHNEIDWLGSITEDAKTCTVKVFTNRSDARFVAEDDSGNVVASGAGTQATLTWPAQNDRCSTVVRFLPVIEVPANGATVTLTAPPVSLDIGADVEASAVGAYQ